MASMAYRIISTGVDTQVPVYRRNRVEKTINGQTLQVLETQLTGEKEKAVAYADIVIMSDASPSEYESMFRWYKSSIGKSHAQAKEIKPSGKVPVVKQMRVYWFSKDTYTYKDGRSGVIGWKELLGQLKLPEALYNKLIATGDASVVGALKALNLLKMEHDKGLHYTVLGSVKTDLLLKRGIFSYLLQTKSFLWAKDIGNNRSSHLWKENVHGVVVQKMVDHMKTIGGVDSALDCMNGLMDLLDDVEEEVEITGEVIMSLRATGKWEEETYLDSRGKESYRYTSPTGEIIEKPALGCTDYASAQGKYNAAMSAFTKQQESDRRSRM
jgi:hypothetical protein